MEFINTTYGKAEVLFEDRNRPIFVGRINEDGFEYALKYDEDDNLYALLVG